MIKSLLISFLAFSSLALAEEKDPLELNKKVVQFVEANLGKKVYEGEAVDLPQEALKASGAKWKFETETVFGQEVNTRRDDIEPGDIIQFDDAEYENKDTKEGWKLGNMTVVVMTVNKKENKIKFAVQNLFNKLFVTTHDLEMNTLKRGRLKIFRPQPGVADVQSGTDKESKTE
ncbi:MAG: hypothetical protein B7Y39_11985 [Bdellovibrio sp. 28-41-41]|nr:MAG: hypothetical protein B7Y39_11985 [Bdellovibrio sp. 28-41-41]